MSSDPGRGAEGGSSPLTDGATPRDDEGATVILATHDPRATEVADRTVTIRDGRVTGELHGGNGRRWVFVDDGGLIRLDPDDLLKTKG